MYGEITKFRDDLGVGVIAAEDGQKYRFRKDAIVSVIKRMVGEDVDFIAEARRPRQIILLSGSGWTAFGGIAASYAANDR
jgi:hypothetical protein